MLSSKKDCNFLKTCFNFYCVFSIILPAFWRINVPINVRSYMRSDVDNYVKFQLRVFVENQPLAIFRFSDETECTESASFWLGSNSILWTFGKYRNQRRDLCPSVWEADGIQPVLKRLTIFTFAQPCISSLLALAALRRPDTDKLHRKPPYQYTVTVIARIYAKPLNKIRSDVDKFKTVKIYRHDIMTAELNILSG